MPQEVFMKTVIPDGEADPGSGAGCSLDSLSLRERAGVRGYRLLRIDL
jgi:hypothetical protein